MERRNEMKKRIASKRVSNWECFTAYERRLKVWLYYQELNGNKKS